MEIGEKIEEDIRIFIKKVRQEKYKEITTEEVDLLNSLKVERYGNNRVVRFVKRKFWIECVELIPMYTPTCNFELNPILEHKRIIFNLNRFLRKCKIGNIHKKEVEDFIRNRVVYLFNLEDRIENLDKVDRFILKLKDKRIVQINEIDFEYLNIVSITDTNLDYSRNLLEFRYLHDFKHISVRGIFSCLETKVNIDIRNGRIRERDTINLDFLMIKSRLQTFNINIPSRSELLEYIEGKHDRKVIDMNKIRRSNRR